MVDNANFYDELRDVQKLPGMLSLAPSKQINIYNPGD